MAHCWQKRTPADNTNLARRRWKYFVGKSADKQHLCCHINTVMSLKQCSVDKALESTSLHQCSRPSAISHLIAANLSWCQHVMFYEVCSVKLFPSCRMLFRSFFLFRVFSECADNRETSIFPRIVQMGGQSCSPHLALPASYTHCQCMLSVHPHVASGLPQCIAMGLRHGARVAR